MAQLSRRRRIAARVLATVMAPLWAASVGACGGGEDRIELRLQPCDIDGLPRSVRVRVEAFDAEGVVLGQPKSESFAIPEVSVFDDGYATVGYVPPAGATSATVTIGWFSETSAGNLAASEHVVLWPNIKLPALGESIDLAAEGCTPFGGTSGSGTDGTDTEGTSGTATAGTTTAGTTTTGTTTEGTTTTGTTTSTTTLGTTTLGTTTGGDTLGGMECEDGALDQCETPAPGEVGTLYSCIEGTWTENVAAKCGDICAGAFIGFSDGQALGCSGNGEGPGWGCLCVEGDGEVPCDDTDQKCTTKMGSPLIQLCLDGGLVRGSCGGTCDDEIEPSCAP